MIHVVSTPIRLPTLIGSRLFFTICSRSVRRFGSSGSARLQSSLNSLRPSIIFVQNALASQVIEYELLICSCTFLVLLRDKVWYFYRDLILNSLQSSLSGNSNFILEFEEPIDWSVSHGSALSEVVAVIRFT